MPNIDIMALRGSQGIGGQKEGVGKGASLDYIQRYDKASMSTTHGAVKTRCHEDTTDDVYLVGAGCVVCAEVRMGLGSGSKVWNLGTWIRCVRQ
jgi:hypothetical protein